jgi:hypothetical protein
MFVAVKATIKKFHKVSLQIIAQEYLAPIKTYFPPIFKVLRGYVNSSGIGVISQATLFRY